MTVAAHCNVTQRTLASLSGLYESRKRVADVVMRKWYTLSVPLSMARVSMTTTAQRRSYTICQKSLMVDCFAPWDRDKSKCVRL